MSKFLATTFSPAMLKPGRAALVEESSLEDARELLCDSWTSAVGHDVTAGILTALLGFRVPFARVNLALDHGDQLVCVIPNFRASEAREFSSDEVEAAGFRCFLVTVGDV